jgi:hypothetical protein
VLHGETGMQSVSIHQVGRVPITSNMLCNVSSNVSGIKKRILDGVSESIGP